MRKIAFLPIVFLLLLAACQHSSSPSGPQSTGTDTIFPYRIDSFTIKGEHHYVDGYPSFYGDEGGSVMYVVIEIPTGTTEKWEVDKESGLLKWEMEDGEPRVVKYLGYPGNYGMVPGTLLPKEKGGDGDPIDVIVLGPPVERGAVVMTVPVGVLKLLDRGERDDKIIAVRGHTPFRKIQTIKELQEQFPGVLDILETWFVNYKGHGKMKSLGFGDENEAKALVGWPDIPTPIDELARELNEAIDGPDSTPDNPR